MGAKTQSPKPARTFAWANDTFEACRLGIYQNAATAFADHKLEEVGPFEWRCAKPHTGFYSFQVLIRPSLVFVWGDIGHAIFRGGDAGGTAACTLEWLREVIAALRGDRYEPSYLCSKLKLRAKDFYPGDALNLCVERLQEDHESEPWKRLLRHARERYEDYGLTQRDWSGLVMDYVNDPEYCSVGVDDTSETLWVVEGLRWFCAHLPQAESGKIEEALNGG